MSDYGDHIQMVYHPLDSGSRTYITETGDVPTIASRRVTSKLYGVKRFLSNRTRPTLTARLQRLIERTDLRGLGVDFVRDNENRFWAIDLNLAAGYRNTGLEPAIYRSIRASLPDQ